MPFFWAPLKIHQISKICIVERQVVFGPPTFKSTSFSVTPPKCVRPAESHDVTIIETHTVKDITEMTSTFWTSPFIIFVGIREKLLCWTTRAFVGINATKFEWDFGAS